MGQKRQDKEGPKEKVQDNKESNQRCNDCFQCITNLIVLLVILDFICKALEEE